MNCDILVIGGGPAGMTAAQYSARGGRKTILIDPMPGGQLALIHKIENYPGFESISGGELMEKMFNQTESFGVAIKYLTAKSLRKIEDYHFEVDTEEALEILSRQLTKLDQEQALSILCTCVFYIADYNSKLIEA